MEVALVCELESICRTIVVPGIHSCRSYMFIKREISVQIYATSLFLYKRVNSFHRVLFYKRLLVRTLRQNDDRITGKRYI